MILDKRFFPISRVVGALSIITQHIKAPLRYYHSPAFVFHNVPSYSGNPFHQLLSLMLEDDNIPHLQLTKNTAANDDTPPF